MLTREVQKLEYESLIQTVEDHLGSFEFVPEDSIYKHTSSKKKMKDYKFEFRLQMLAYEKDLILKQQEIVRRLIALHHEKQMRRLEGQQARDTLELSFLFSSTIMAMEERITNEINLLATDIDQELDDEIGGSEVDTEGRHSSHPRASPVGTPARDEVHEVHESRTPNKLSPRYHSSKDSTPRSSPRRLPPPSTAPREISASRNSRRKSSPRHVPREGSSWYSNLWKGRNSVDSRTNESSPRSDYYSPEGSTEDSAEVERLTQVGLCYESTSGSTSSSTESSTEGSTSDETNSKGSVKDSDNESDLRASPKDVLGVQQFTDFHELQRAYMLERDKIRQLGLDALHRIKQKEVRLEADLAVPVVSLILLNYK